MMRIGMIGAGNVGWNLAAGFEKSPFALTQVLSRSVDSAANLAEEFHIPHAGVSPGDLLPDLDLVILATSDHSVATVASSLGTQFPKTTFVHTSGSIPMEALAPTGSNIGVFYPMQTFTKGRRANWKEIPLFLEGDIQVLDQIRPLAEHLSDRVSVLDSKGRLKLHMGAVLVSNFVNYLFLMTSEMVSDLPAADLTTYEPLIREVVDKAFAIGPFKAHTGPARRGDNVTMQKHLDLLEGKEKDLYALISDMIYSRWSR